ncbi:MAG TPA: DUF3568 family protein [Gemmatimonadales bacterium]|jgi:hypothetical protein|nr:DUF3568 family protein [Gemmatimonadales bacterium]
MSRKFSEITKWIMVLAMAGTVPACAAAAAAGAGAATGVYLTSRGAKSLVPMSLDDAVARSRAVLTQLNVTMKDSETNDQGDERELHGTTPDGLDIGIQLDRQDAQSTNIEVTTKKNLVDYDKDYSQMVLRKIIEQDQQS